MDYSIQEEMIREIFKSFGSIDKIEMPKVCFYVLSYLALYAIVCLQTTWWFTLNPAHFDVTEHYEWKEVRFPSPELFWSFF